MNIPKNSEMIIDIDEVHNDLEMRQNEVTESLKFASDTIKNGGKVIIKLFYFERIRREDELSRWKKKLNQVQTNPENCDEWSIVIDDVNHDLNIIGTNETEIFKNASDTIKNGGEVFIRRSYYVERIISTEDELSRWKEELNQIQTNLGRPQI